MTFADRVFELFNPYSESDFQRKIQTLPWEINRTLNLRPRAGVRRIAQGEEFPAGQGTESGGQRARDKHYGQGPEGRPGSGEAGASRREGSWGRPERICSRQVAVRQAGAVRETSLRKGGVGAASLGRERVVRRLLEAARLQGTASPGARPPSSGPPPRPARPGHSWPVPRTPMGRRARPPPRPPSQTWCPGRCRE